MKEQDMGHLKYIDGILKKDFTTISEKEAMYKGSWKSRGGIGAFFVTARKWDALENMLENPKYMYNILHAFIQGGDGDGSPAEQIRDLRRYLTLIEAEAMRITEPKPSVARDDKDGSTLKGQGAYGVGEEFATVLKSTTEATNDRKNS